MRKLRVSVGAPSSIDAAIAGLRRYRAVLPERAGQLQRRLAEAIRELAEAGFNGAGYDDVLHEGMKVPDVRVEVTEEGALIAVVAYGKEAVFAEYGAGVYYNPSGSGHPERPAGIVRIGEYGNGYGKRRVWGYWEDGVLKLTHGTPASMPMYLAAQEAARLLPELARDVFSEGGGAV